MKKIIIAGGSGLVGQALTKKLEDLGYDVYLLSRKKRLKGWIWDPSKHYIEEGALENTYAVINLAGAGIADQHWTDSRKKIITQSRVFAAETFDKAFENEDFLPEVYLSAGAIGYYGDRGSQWLSESSENGSDFLSESCVAWEGAVQKLNKYPFRLVQFRIGIVLSKFGGAYEKMHLPYKLGCATYFGDGLMWYSWIHIDDLVAMFVYALEQEKVTGIYNAVAPQPVTNRELIKAMKTAGGRPSLLCSVPEFLLRLTMGEMAAVILSSSKVSSEKITTTGFEYKWPTIDQAMEALNG